MSKKKRVIGLVILVVLLLGVGGYFLTKKSDSKSDAKVTDYKSCVAAGNPIQESYPEVCVGNGKSYVNPDQKAPAAPGNTGTDSSSNGTETAAVDDDQLIRDALVSYCTANGATDAAGVEAILKENMTQDNLYVKSGSFARLSSSCGDGGFRAFVRKTEDGKAWKFMFGTQMETGNCSAMDGIGMPAAVATQCYGDDGELRAIK